jgi:hypothetical protein
MRLGGSPGTTHALTTLGDGLVGQADDGEGRHARADLHLHIDAARLDPLESDRRDPREHRLTPVPNFVTLAKARDQGKNNQRTLLPCRGSTHSTVSRLG